MKHLLLSTITALALATAQSCDKPPPADCEPDAAPDPCELAVYELSPSGAKEIVDLPRSMRQENWTVNGEGSCVHASTVHLLRWQGQHGMADWWRAHHGAGEYSDRLNRKMEAAGLRYAYTDSGDIKFLEWAMRTRRGAGITYWPSHAVNLVHLDDEWAGILDNNRINQIIWVRREEFLRNWRGYGGWAWTLVYRPPPPEPWW